MKILITGGLGFVGGHLRRALSGRGNYTTIVDPGPFGDGMSCLQYFEEHPDERFDVVYHCAAFVNGRAGIDGRPAHLRTYNTMLDAAMFTWALRARPSRVVYFSSAAAYPLCLQQEEDGLSFEPLREERLDHSITEAPETTYGLSKIHGEQMALSVREAGVPVTVLRPFSGYGPDQDLNYPFPAFIARARQKLDPFQIWGDGTQQRDWVHIDDLVGAAIAAVEQGVDGPVNICTGRGTSFRELAELVTATAGYSPEFECLPDRPAGVAYRVGDLTKLNEFYTCKITLEQGVEHALRD